MGRIRLYKFVLFSQLKWSRTWPTSRINMHLGDKVETFCFPSEVWLAKEIPWGGQGEVSMLVHAGDPNQEEVGRYACAPWGQEPWWHQYACAPWGLWPRGGQYACVPWGLWPWWHQYACPAYGLVTVMASVCMCTLGTVTMVASVCMCSLGTVTRTRSVCVYTVGLETHDKVCICLHVSVQELWRAQYVCMLVIEVMVKSVCMCTPRTRNHFETTMLTRAGYRSHGEVSLLLHDRSRSPIKSY